jgi:hypothetical protein
MALQTTLELIQKRVLTGGPKADNQSVKYCFEMRKRYLAGMESHVGS